MARRSKNSDEIIYDLTDDVELRKDVESWHLKKGTKGTIIQHFGADLYEVAFKECALVVNKHLLKLVWNSRSKKDSIPS